MTIPEIYEKFDQIGCVDFSTWNGTSVQSRIAHFFAADADGLYLRTMTVKPFYKQMKQTGNISACGMYPSAAVTHDAEGLPSFEPGYTIRISGDVRELTMEEVQEKAKTLPEFYVATFDIQKYPATRVFVLYRAWGELYDFDYEWKTRDHKLERARFAFGGATFEPPGLTITENCIACGACEQACSFSAIVPGQPYSILGNRCDECGNCYTVCPAGAVVSKGK